MPVSAIIGRLGPAARDIGSGLYVLEWDVTDGRKFFVSTAGLCEKPFAAGFAGPTPILERLRKGANVQYETRPIDSPKWRTELMCAFGSRDVPGHLHFRL